MKSNKPQEPDTMNEYNTPEAARLNYEAQNLWLAGRNQEARAAYCKALEAGYRTPSELEAAKQRRQQWEIIGFCAVVALGLAAIFTARFWVFA
jgi:hypothetical protein